MRGCAPRLRPQGGAGPERRIERSPARAGARAGPGAGGREGRRGARTHRGPLCVRGARIGPPLKALQ